MSTGSAAPGAAVGSAAERRLGLRLVLLLGGLATVSPFATDMYLPALPEIADELGVGQSTVQATLTAYLVPLALGQLLAGSVADARGRRPVVVVGSLLLVQGSVVCATAPGVAVLCAGRVLQGLGGAAAMVAGRAMVADLLEGRRAARAFIAIGTVAALGPVLAPTLGAWLAGLAGWRSIFWAIAATQVVLTAMALSAAETLPVADREPGALRRLGPRIRTLAGLPAYRWQVLVSVSSFTGLFAYISAAPFVADEIGLSTRDFTTLFAVNGLGMLAFSALSSAVVVRLGRRRLIATGLWTTLAGAGCLAIAACGTGEVPLVLAGFFLVCCAKGSVGGASLSLAASASPDAPAVALAAVGSVQFLAAGAAAVATGVSPGHSLVPVTVTIAAAGLLALAAHRRAARP
ncbi:Bcr/CflA family efflux MFS transporter [Nocardioides mangrovi]|uniref:Bcr/CflA family efflux MFS transporter n=1 Tax=Nocardioides mangrovi TaxID=2874580 RepID=A0ABS7UEV4_9ACTN|nr:Bcr/CflA family efflux MFS transporter [Nocardioides mangrovi]MBZ5739534.1 Bcr/CflA family efflux MFS transporter [Nocardioides mangrovi]